MIDRAPLPAPILLLGGSGLVGRAWRERLEYLDLPWSAPVRSELDLADPDTPRRIEQGPWKLIINAAAIADVDAAERDEPHARRINGEAVGAIAKACATSGARLLHYSTDYVFDGNAAAPYSVRHVRNPINAYGRSKALAEELIEISGAHWLIIRTSWVYAPWARNFVGLIAHKLRERPTITVPDAQRGRPTSAEHLVRASCKLLAHRAEGIWHLTDGGSCTRYEMACEIASHLPGAGAVTRAESAHQPGTAPRPLYCVLDLARTENLLGPTEDWRVRLADVVARLEW